MFPLSGLVSFWTLGPDLPALLLCMSSCFLAAPLSLSLAVGWFLCVVWFQTINLSTAPCLPSQSSHKFRLLHSAPNPELTWRGRILFSSPKPHQSFEHKWPFRPECNFRTPLPNLSVPSPALTHSHFTSRLRDHAWTFLGASLLTAGWFLQAVRDLAGSRCWAQPSAAFLLWMDPGLCCFYGLGLANCRNNEPL